MKNIKLIAILFISLFLVNVNVKAFENTHDITYDFIYNNVVLKAQENDNDFDFSVYNKFVCGPVNSELYCRFFNETDLNKFVLENNGTNTNLSKSEDFNYYYIFTNKTFSYTIVRYQAISNSYYSGNVYTNISDYKDLTNVIYLDDGTEDEVKELEVTIKGTEILNFMLDKTKNIYEVLIANQIFILCLGVLLSYLIFMVIYRALRK